jgi:hypothetical protein
MSVEFTSRLSFMDLSFFPNAFLYFTSVLIDAQAYLPRSTRTYMQQQISRLRFTSDKGTPISTNEYAAAQNLAQLFRGLVGSPCKPYFCIVRFSVLPSVLSSDSHGFSVVAFVISISFDLIPSRLISSITQLE